MAKSTSNDEGKWFMIGLALLALAFMLPVALSEFAPDHEAERIAACMTQPNMQYVDGNCVPQEDIDVN